MLDEFPALGRLDFFESALAFMAGYGMKAFLIAIAQPDREGLWAEQRHPRQLPCACDLRHQRRTDRQSIASCGAVRNTPLGSRTRTSRSTIRPKIDRKSPRLNSSNNAHLVCRILLEKKKYNNKHRLHPTYGK